MIGFTGNFSTIFLIWFLIENENKLVIQLNHISSKLKSFYIDQKKYEKLIEKEKKSRRIRDKRTVRIYD